MSNETQPKTIIYDKKESVAWITLNRPEVYNAQNDVLRGELIEALEKARDDNEVYAIVLTGAGDKAFSAGADIGDFPTWTPATVIKKFKGIRWPHELVREIPKPVIAMVNGLTLGAGCEVAIACDMIIASENAKFGLPEITVGVIPGGGGTQMLPRLIGEKKAKELILLGQAISAEEAYRMGMVNKVVPKEKLTETVEEYLELLKKKSPVVLKIAKMAVNKALETPLSIGLSCEQDLFAVCFGTEDQKEGAKAFVEKRPPSFKGR